MTPAISVIMPVYNSGKFLAEAIDSILGQSFKNFELLIFDDGSTDDSKTIISSYHDERIIFFDDHSNKGIASRFNQGIDAARGKYIARMDSDDVAVRNRFELQYEFMERNDDVSVCGGFFEFIGSPAFNWVSQEEDGMIKINLLFDGAICNPTVLIRAASLQGDLRYFNAEYEPSEDYEMWVRMSRFLKFKNLRNILVRYRLNENQVSNRKNQRQRQYKFIAIKTQLSYLGIIPTELEMRLHDYAFYPSVVIAYDYLPKVKAWFAKLQQANNVHHIYQTALFARYLADLYAENERQFSARLRELPFSMKIQYYLKSMLRWQSLR